MAFVDQVADEGSFAACEVASYDPEVLEEILVLVGDTIQGVAHTAFRDSLEEGSPVARHKVRSADLVGVDSHCKGRGIVAGIWEVDHVLVGYMDVAAMEGLEEVTDVVELQLEARLLAEHSIPRARQ